jgi:hypothetical protein
MVDFSGRVDSLVVPGAVTAQDIGVIWGRIIDIPSNVTPQCDSHNGVDYHWGFGDSSTPLIPCTVRSRGNHRDANICDGSNIFRAEQRERLRGVKIPPFDLDRITSRANGDFIFESNEEWVALSQKVLKDHIFSWNVNGLILEAPQITTWWVPYD